MRKLSADELATARDREDWGTLWLAARPLVKFTIRRMIHRGEVDPSRWIDADLRQEGLLAAGIAVRSWNTIEGAFSTWVSANVRGALLKAGNKEARSGFGGLGDTPFVVSGQEKLHDENYEDDDDDAEAVKQDLFVYEEDEVFLSPVTAAERANAVRLLAQLDPVDEEIARRLFGVDCGQQTERETAVAMGISRRRVRLLAERLGRFTKSAGAIPG